MMWKSGRRLFTAIHVLVLAQVAWWAWVFARDADIIGALSRENAVLAARDAGRAVDIEVLKRFDAEVFHRKAMFLSETLFFATVACVGLWLLFRALREERRSRQVQRNFIEIVSHESKTPLTALKLRLESLQEAAASADPEMALSLSRALDEVRRLSGVLEKTMALNRTERDALHFEPVALADVVESVVRRLEPWLEAKQARVALDLDRDLEVQGDFAGLQNSVQSLVENAVLYNPRAPREVNVKVRERGGKALLSVSDNGPGISSGDAQHVFERFYRGDAGRGVSGTGLGLYLAKIIVEAHRGVLRLAQATSGARFEIELPRGHA